MEKNVEGIIYPVVSGSIIALPKATWVWHVFGYNLWVVRLNIDVPWWRRMLTRILLGSVWERA